MSVLVIGAAGAVGKRLIGALASRGERIVAVDKAPQLPESIKHLVQHAETNKDVRDFYTMQRIFQRHRFVHGLEPGRAAVGGDGEEPQNRGAGDHQRHAQCALGHV